MRALKGAKGKEEVQKTQQKNKYSRISSGYDPPILATLIKSIQSRISRSKNIYIVWIDERVAFNGRHQYQHQTTATFVRVHSLQIWMQLRMSQTESKKKRYELTQCNETNGYHHMQNNSIQRINLNIKHLNLNLYDKNSVVFMLYKNHVIETQFQFDISICISNIQTFKFWIGYL